MLTFDFTGVSGEMTVPERLTSGMTGRQITINLSDDWAELEKTVVFLAGDICRTAELTGNIVTIPADVLRYPFRQLLVGVFGTNAEDTLVIPTILAEGPFVERGADPAADPIAVDIPIWRKIQNQIGSLAQLRTDAKGTLVSAINELADRSFSSGGSGEAGTDGKDGKDGKDGENGADGFSIFAVSATIDPVALSAISVKPDMITTNGRTIQVGDFLLTENGCLAQVSAASSLSVSASFLLNLMGTAPVRGTDYWTEADIAEIKSYVDEAILGGTW